MVVDKELIIRVVRVDMAKTNLFKLGDLVETPNGRGIIVKNCAYNYRFWDVEINERVYSFPFGLLELTFEEKDGEG